MWPGEAEIGVMHSLVNGMLTASKSKKSREMGSPLELPEETSSANISTLGQWNWILASKSLREYISVV